VTTYDVGFENLTAVVRKSSFFWKIAPCSQFKVNRPFGGTRRLQLQGRRISQARNQREASSKQNRRPLFRCFLSGMKANQKRLQSLQPVSGSRSEPVASEIRTRGAKGSITTLLLLIICSTSE
jgi:hypothetical protein